MKSPKCQFITSLATINHTATKLIFYFASAIVFLVVTGVNSFLSKLMWSPGLPPTLSCHASEFWYNTENKKSPNPEEKLTLVTGTLWRCHFRTEQWSSFHRKTNISISNFFNQTFFFDPGCFSFSKWTLKLWCSYAVKLMNFILVLNSVHPFRTGLAAVISFSTANHSKFTRTESFTGSAKLSPLFWGSFRISSITTSSTNLRLQLVDSRISENKLFPIYSWLSNFKVKWKMYFRQTKFANSFSVFSNVI